MEFFDFKSLFMEYVPLDDAVLEKKPNDESEDENIWYRMNVIWFHLYNMKSPLLAKITDLGLCSELHYWFL